jgi:hypothetical protein
MIAAQQRLRAPRRAATTNAGRTRTVRVQAAWVNPLRDDVREAAKHIAQPGKGILASDESNATTGKRLNAVGVENTEENRRDWRELLYSTPGLGNHIAGCIMFDETIWQKAADGRNLVDVLLAQGIYPGAKLDTGLQARHLLFFDAMGCEINANHACSRPQPRRNTPPKHPTDYAAHGRDGHAGSGRPSGPLQSVPRARRAFRKMEGGFNNPTKWRTAVGVCHF